jgi:peptide-methionine (S)-S-oxide reductase
MFFANKKLRMPDPKDVLPGRAAPMQLGATHFVNGHRIVPPFPEGMARAMFGLGCFWGAERMFWEVPGVYSTAVGYAGGTTPNPTYEEVCSGMTGHTEVVLVIYDPTKVSYEKLLAVFWENHDPTQGMRQGNDAGTQYRSAIYTFDNPAAPSGAADGRGQAPTVGAAQQAAAEASRTAFQPRLTAAGYGSITTEIIPAPTFYYAEDYHQQYLGKNPNGYCGLAGTGVSCPLPTRAVAATT